MTLKSLIAAALAPLARTITADKPRILFYHRFGKSDNRAISPELFEQQILFLKRHFALVPLSTITEALRSGLPLPKRVVALTVDDGYVDFLHFVYPVIKKHGVPITVFVVSAFSAESAWLWYDRVRFVCAHTTLPHVAFSAGGRAFKLDLSNEAARETAWDEVCSWCLALATEERLQLVSTFEVAARVSLPDTPPIEFRGMSPQELCSMDSALVEVGAHTRTHVILASCNEQEQKNEIYGSKVTLERLIGRPVEHFAYPNGQEKDFNATSVDLVKAGGFKAAVTVKGSLVENGTNAFCIPRLCASFDMNVFCNEVSGVSYLKQRLSAFGLKLKAK